MVYYTSKIIMLPQTTQKQAKIKSFIYILGKITVTPSKLTTFFNSNTKALFVNLHPITTHSPTFHHTIHFFFFPKKNIYIKSFTFYIRSFTIQINKSLRNKFFHFSIPLFHFSISIIYLLIYLFNM